MFPTKEERQQEGIADYVFQRVVDQIREIVDTEMVKPENIERIIKRINELQLSKTKG